MNRRDILKTGAALVAGAVIAPIIRIVPRVGGKRIYGKDVKVVFDDRMIKLAQLPMPPFPDPMEEMSMEIARVMALDMDMVFTGRYSDGTLSHLVQPE